MTLYENHRNEPYFSFAKVGEKTIEARLRKGKYALIKPGDTIKVHSTGKNDCFLVKVTDVRSYKSFKEMLAKEDIKKVLPNVKDINGAINIYRKFYTKEQEKKCEVVAIEVNVIE